MDKKSAKKATELLSEIENLSGYKNFLTNKNWGDSAHFEFVQHYGNIKETPWLKIEIDKRHTPLFVKVLEGIIESLEKELEALS